MYKWHDLCRYEWITFQSTHEEIRAAMITASCRRFKCKWHNLCGYEGKITVKSTFEQIRSVMFTSSCRRFI